MSCLLSSFCKVSFHIKYLTDMLEGCPTELTYFFIVSSFPRLCEEKEGMFRTRNFVLQPQECPQCITLWTQEIILLHVDVPHISDLLKKEFNFHLLEQRVPCLFMVN